MLSSSAIFRLGGESIPECNASSVAVCVQENYSRIRGTLAVGPPRWPSTVLGATLASRLSCSPLLRLLFVEPLHSLNLSHILKVRPYQQHVMLSPVGAAGAAGSEGTSSSVGSEVCPMDAAVGGESLPSPQNFSTSCLSR